MKASLPAVAVLSAMLFAPWANAQTVYRCGNNYSQAPCPAGAAIQVDDPRTPGQKQQADSATQRDAKLASTMEKSRLKEEALAAKKLAPKATKAVKHKPAQDKEKPATGKKKKKAEDAVTYYSPPKAPGTKKTTTKASKRKTDGE